MRAHIVESGIVVNTIEVESLNFMPGLVEAVGAEGIGWAYDGTSFYLQPLSPEQIEEKRKAAIPASVSPRQIRQALTRAGLRAPVEAGIAAGSQDMKDWYEFATAFERSHPMVGALAQGLGVTDIDLDNLFTLAGSL